ncbi:MAG: DUF922 domain-containing protein [Verrucomicrobia bacterium]|nr:DUF922 domain-containing protein [Verrucomicrobiota bacterium]
MVGFAATSAPVQDKVRWTTNYYSVSGDTLLAIQDSLHAGRPWKDKSALDGSTEWQVDWRFKLRRSEDGCQIQQFTTTTTIVITLPRWTTWTNAAPGVRQAWTRYIAALGQHEAGHAKIGLAAAAELRKQVKELGEDQPCETLKETVDALGQRVVTEFKGKDKEYDRVSQHGATQGARLPIALPRER